jgi:hypothetical protein
MKKANDPKGFQDPLELMLTPVDSSCNALLIRSKHVIVCQICTRQLAPVSRACAIFHNTCNLHGRPFPSARCRDSAFI